MAARALPAQLTAGERIFCACGNRSIEAPDGATKETKYTCLDCARPSPDDDRFQAFAFDSYFKPRAKDLRGDGASAPTRRVRTNIDQARDSFVSAGMRFFKIRGPRKNAPEWVFDDDFLKRLVTKYSKGDEVARRLSLLYLYYRCGVKIKHLAKQFGITKGSVKDAIRRLRRRAESELKKTSS